ncbi:hypothetical protein RMSM_04419 [Rhodopirellula maiorica SM1]|uniref:Uncharacterized protein n=1 Tax=Rhodopirellula maiorica SM1 TaxID=1265738 RepID=M5RH12_9BACT|nr:hypothetical protein [Rhodopirellula maiorica]EMI18658.1 hypothetical protein RMSM_04419 [Rhodopirellula maiorica SM1]
MYSQSSNVSLSSDAIQDLNRVAEAIESLEIQLSVLSVQMHYDKSRFSPRAMELTRELGEIHRLLENTLTFGS